MPDLGWVIIVWLMAMWQDHQRQLEIDKLNRVIESLEKKVKNG